VIYQLIAIWAHPCRAKRRFPSRTGIFAAQGYDGYIRLQADGKFTLADIARAGK
jgi:hypothetical protein